MSIEELLPCDSVIGFGKHSPRTVRAVVDEDIAYASWLYERKPELFEGLDQTLIDEVKYYDESLDYPEYDDMRPDWGDHEDYY